MSEEQNRAAFEAWYKQNFHSQDDLYHKRGFENCWQAALSAKSVPPIERDEEMQRDYIPLPANWEVQTKGKGSTFRLAKTDGSGIRWPILEERLHKPLEQMAREIHAAWQAATQAPTDDERVRELNQVFDNCRVIFFPKNGEYPIEHNPHANKISKDEILKAIASLSSGEQG